MAKETLISLQYLRAIAALMVVLHHARNSHSWLFNPIEDYYAFALGVDIFFVISGFVMYLAARNEYPTEFLRKRIIRVVPLYWIATLALVILNTRLNFSMLTTEEFVHILKSLFFIPHYSYSRTSEIWPYLVPGWTLNYEMFFYLIFCIGLIFTRTLLLTSVVIGSLALLGFLIESKSAVITFYTEPLLIEFLLGMWVAYAYLNNMLSKFFITCLPFGFIGLFSIPFVADADIRLMIKIISSTMIVVGAVAYGPRSNYSKLLNLLGDASYSIYLTHAVISLDFAEKVWRKLPLDGWPQFIGWVVFSLLISSIVGVLVHLYAEKPSIAWLRKNWHGKTRKA
jgi:exopolysaccharide production protein ExoZ